MKLGIVGLPNVGKSTLFNAITNAGAQSANYPFCTIEPNVGVVAVPDKRLDKLAEMYEPDKFTPATIEFVDIAGLVKGASKGEGLGNKFLSNIREVDAIVHVVRCFENDDIIHVEGSIDPKRDIETIDVELILSDIEVLDRRIDKTRKMLKADKKYQAELDFLERVHEALEAGQVRPQRGVHRGGGGDPLHRVPADQQAHHLRRQHERGRFPGRRGKQQVLPGGAGVRPGGARRGAAHLRGDRGGDLRHGARRRRVLFLSGHGAGGVRPGPADPSLLLPAGADLLPDRRQAGGAGLDHPEEAPRPPRPPARSTRTSSGASSGRRSSALTS